MKIIKINDESLFKIVDKVREEIISWIDDESEEDNLFGLGNDITRFRFRTDDDLVYNKKN